MFDKPPTIKYNFSVNAHQRPAGISAIRYSADWERTFFITSPEAIIPGRKLDPPGFFFNNYGNSYGGEYELFCSSADFELI